MKSGVGASVDAAGGRDVVRAADDARRAEGEQLALLEAEADRELDAALPLPPPRRGPGRPPGARNKRTEALAAYYLGRYGDPLEGLLALGTGDLRHTHLALQQAARATGLPLGGLTVLQLLAFKRDCLKEALPYLHAKRAPENDKGEAVVPILALGTLAPGVEPGVRLLDGARSILDFIDVTPVAAESVEDQGLSAGEGAGSHERGSHDAG